MQLPPSAGLSIVATLASLGVAVFAWRRRPTPGADFVTAFSLGAAIWTGGNALQTASTTLYDKLFWVDVQYVGIAVVPLAWFAFACEYADREEWTDARTLALVGTPLVLTVALAWTNEYHHLIRTSSAVVTVRGNAMLERTFGPAFWASWVYSNLVTGIGTILLLRKVVRARRIYRRQAFAILGGTTVPWVASGTFYNGLTSLEPEVFFSVSSVAFAYAIAQYDLLDVVPVGRDTVVEEMDDCVLVLDGDDRVVDANPAASRVFGWPDADAAIGRPIAETDVPHAQLLDARATGRSASGTPDGNPPGVVALEDDDGDRRYFDVRRSALSDLASSAAGTVLILRDVTELKRQETRLERKNDRLERVGETIAHDLRNPLNVAQGRLELAMESDAPDEHLAEIETAHERMDAIIGKLLAMAREEAADPDGRVELRQVASDAWRTVETGDATLELACDDAAVLADGDELASLFENLFRNSVEHGGDGVTVRVGELDDGAGFYVEDDGAGLPDDGRDCLFESGYTTRTGGTGVGLTVVGDVADRHGWTVEATDGDAGGARFELRGVETAPAPAQ